MPIGCTRGHLENAFPHPRVKLAAVDRSLSPALANVFMQPLTPSRIRHASRSPHWSVDGIKITGAVLAAASAGTLPPAPPHLAYLSDQEVQLVAQETLLGLVDPMLLQKLSRRNIVSLLTTAQHPPDSGASPKESSPKMDALEAATDNSTCDTMVGAATSTSGLPSCRSGGRRAEGNSRSAAEHQPTRRGSGSPGIDGGHGIQIESSHQVASVIAEEAATTNLDSLAPDKDRITEHDAICAQYDALVGPHKKFFQNLEEAAAATRNTAVVVTSACSDSPSPPPPLNRTSTSDASTLTQTPTVTQSTPLMTPKNSELQLCVPAELAGAGSQKNDWPSTPSGDNDQRWSAYDGNSGLQAKDRRYSWRRRVLAEAEADAAGRQRRLPQIAEVVTHVQACITDRNAKESPLKDYHLLLRMERERGERVASRRTKSRGRDRRPAWRD